MDRVEMREVKEELFLQQIKNAYENSPFYRRKYQELGIDVDDIKHLADIKNFHLQPKRNSEKLILSDLRQLMRGK